jgi:hypothetical protein
VPCLPGLTPLPDKIQVPIIHINRNRKDANVFILRITSIKYVE